MIPLLHDFSGTVVLVFGGGAVGARKARRFAREARVIVVSPAFTTEDFDGAERVRAAPNPEDLPTWFDRADPALVVAATDSENVNAAIEDEARERGVLVNRADTHGDRDPGSVVVPATIEDDPVTVAIATGGRSPALSRYLRERIETEIAEAGAMADLAGDLRADLHDRDLAPEDRRDALRAVVRSPAVWKALGARGANARREAQLVIEETLPADGGEEE